MRINYIKYEVKLFVLTIVISLIFPFNRSACQNPLFGLVGFASENGGTTGGSGGATVSVNTFADLKKYAEIKDTKYTINVSGHIYNGVKGGAIKVASNKTLVGIGADAFLDGVGLGISGTKNIIIQNIKFTMTSITDQSDPAVYSPTGDEGRPQILVNGGDCISIQGASANVWIDHCEFYNIDPAVQTNQDLYDGLVDVKNASAYITISWCYFHDHHKCSLVGSSDTDTSDRKITFHHNYYKNITERMPLYRYGTGHFFNNYVNGTNDGSAVNSRMKACVRVEKNVFEGKQDPVITKNSVLDGFWDLVNNSNQYNSCKGNQPVTSTCTFTPSYPYSSILNTTADVKKLVMQSAGVGKITDVTGVLEETSFGSAVCFPNPFTTDFNLSDLSGIYQYEIRDASGNIMETGEGYAGSHHGGQLPAGVYILKISKEMDVRIFKLSKLK